MLQIKNNAVMQLDSLNINKNYNLMSNNESMESRSSFQPK
jgi:hypothetical protein